MPLAMSMANVVKNQCCCQKAFMANHSGHVRIVLHPSTATGSFTCTQRVRRKGLLAGIAARNVQPAARRFGDQCRDRLSRVGQNGVARAVMRVPANTNREALMVAEDALQIGDAQPAESLSDQGVDPFETRE